ncbi:MAG TPA: arginine--tRNA ligase [Actinomycetota bacterium]|jgi:arginyl-tRNA synthetase|nr:arginine--tRNA ligase [Actinomycetota bacterium]
MIEEQLARIVREAVAAAAVELRLEDVPDAIEVVRPRQKDHGDYTTNIALALAPRIVRNPRDVADIIVKHLPPAAFVAKAEVAGPGFINFFLAHGWLYEVMGEVERLGPAYGRVDVGAGERVQVEFVSANPTGPLHVGHGRGAAIGDALARLLETAGYRVEREYYVNDAGGQAELFAASLEARYLQRFGREAEIPEGGYQGSYLAELAEEIAADAGDEFVSLPPEERRALLGDEGMRRELDAIRATLDRMNVRIETWFRETTLRAEGRIDQAIQLLKDRELAYEDDGAIWFRSTRFGDEKDRVLVRSNGEPTYFAADCAYLREKFARGFDRLIYVWGADHHGTMKRLVGAAQAFGYEVDRVEFILYQLVNLYRGGEPVRMSKRTGDIITLDEVLDEVGPDAARYTLLTRSTDTALDFDIDLVKSQTLENPVYYVQYAHARIASILRFAEEQGVAMEPFEKVRAEELVHETELDLLRKIAEMPEQVRFAAEGRAPYRLTRYAEELAADFHRFYTECRVVTDDPDLTQARMHLAAATKQVIGNVLAILGVSAPDSMERLEGTE